MGSALGRGPAIAPCIRTFSERAMKSDPVKYILLGLIAGLLFGLTMQVTEIRKAVQEMRNAQHPNGSPSTP